jgi:hypothetical protein
MVMSVAAHDPRVRCIRCGGVEFHILDRIASGRRSKPVSRRSPPTAPMHPTLALGGLRAALVDSLHGIASM